MDRRRCIVDGYILGCEDGTDTKCVEDQDESDEEEDDPTSGVVPAEAHHFCAVLGPPETNRLSWFLNLNYLNARLEKMGKFRFLVIARPSATKRHSPWQDFGRS